MNNKKIEELLKSERFHLFIIVLSLFFFLVTLARTKIGAPEPSVFWYASNLYWTFWPGILLTVFAILLSITNRNSLLKLISVLIPVLYLYTLPNLAHDMLSVFDVYHVIPSIYSIIETGSWNMQTIPFPGSHIFQASGIIILDVQAFSYARIFPTLLAFSIVLFIFTISKRISVKWAPIAPLVFLSLNWYMEYHLARQPFSVMLWTAFWLTLFLYIDKRDYRFGILASIVILALVTAHPGMLIIITFNMIALTLVTFISFRDREESEYLFPFMPLLLFFGVGAALIYAYVPSINEYMNSLILDFMRTTETKILDLSLGGPYETSIQYGFVNQLRMLSGIFYSLLALLGFIAIYKKESKRALLLGAWFFSIFLWLIYPFTHEGHMIERAFLSALIPASVLTVALIKHFKPNNFDLKNFVQVSTIVILIAFLMIVPITKNSIDSIEMPSRASYQAGIFAEENFEDRIYVTDTHEGMFRYIEMIKDSDRVFRSRGTSAVDQPYGYPIPRTDRYFSPVLFTDYFNNYLEIRYGNTTAVEDIERYEKDHEKTSQRVYDSGGSRIYVNL